MGSLTQFEIKRYRDQLQLQVFVETGTFYGDGVQCALEEGFTELHSIELNPHYVGLARERFKGQPVTIWEGASVARLPDLLLKIQGKKALWWLDAHLQDVYGLPMEAAHPLPLEQELQLITSSRDVSGDLFIIDDLRIYEDIPENNWDQEDRKRYADYYGSSKGASFVFDLLGNTHAVTRIFREAGYLMAWPL